MRETRIRTGVRVKFGLKGPERLRLEKSELDNQTRKKEVTFVLDVELACNWKAVLASAAFSKSKSI